MKIWNTYCYFIVYLMKQRKINETGWDKSLPIPVQSHWPEYCTGLKGSHCLIFKNLIVSFSITDNIFLMRYKKTHSMVKGKNMSKLQFVRIYNRILSNMELFAGYSSINIIMTGRISYWFFKSLFSVFGFKLKVGS